MPPAGQLPALEHGLDVVEATGDEQAAAGAIIAYLRAHGADLDARLNAMQVRHRHHPCALLTCNSMLEGCGQP